jgi:squalene-hopene/tetraprenyl-beta-curcumene cyclase
MKAARLILLLIIVPCLAILWNGASDGAVENAAGTTNPTWNQAAAAHYLDYRQTWWQGWQVSQRDHKTVCVSCHTVLPYAFSRSSLGSSLGEAAPSAPEHVMLNNVLRRVTLWNQVEPFYANGKAGPTKTPESRGTEAVLNALILSIYDARNDHLADITRTAFDNAWALQIKTGPQAGAWDWLNFHLSPWESNESQYYGAALAALAVGTAPDGYRNDPKIQGNLKLLRAYLSREYANQPLIDKIYLLWASSKLPGLLDNKERSELVATILSKQQPDGGWSLTDLGTWKRADKTPLETQSDGYATGLTVLALERAGLARPATRKGLTWLEQNQSRDEGKWPAWSVNLKRDPKSDIGRFMSDAATGFAVAALESSH